jgi:hypothetical protein
VVRRKGNSRGYVAIMLLGGWEYGSQNVYLLFGICLNVVGFLTTFSCSAGVFFYMALSRYAHW